MSLEKGFWTNYIFFDSESLLGEPQMAPDGTKIMPHIPRLIVAQAVNARIDADGKILRDSVWWTCHGDGFLEDFWSAVDWFASGENHTRLVAHNVGYDFQVCRGMEFLTKLGWRVDSLYEKGFTYILRLKKGRARLTVLSSTQFFSAPLREVGKAFDLPKLEIPHQTLDINHLITYCTRDVEIVSRAMTWLMDTIYYDDLGPMADTIPSLANKIFRHRFMKQDIMIHNYEPALKLERESYHGGRCEAWWIGEVPEKIYKLDINSAYPYAMRSANLPVALARYWPRDSPPDMAKVLSYMGEDAFMVARVVLDTWEPAYPYLSPEKKLLFPVGEFRTVLSGQTFREAVFRGHVKKVEEAALYHSAPIFREYIDYFYDARVRAKKSGDRARDLLYKLLMNSLYGKFGQTSKVWNPDGIADPSQVGGFSINVGKEKFMVRIFGGVVWLNDGSVMESFESFPAIASGVTSYTYALLYKYITVAGPENVYYMDTDSLFVNKRGADNLKSAGFIDEAKLGYLKLEGTTENLIIRGAKDYQWGEEVTKKGIPRDATLYEEDGELKAKFWSWPKTGTWLRKGTLNEFYNVEVSRRMKTPYSKGVVTTTGRVTPFVLHL